MSKKIFVKGFFYGDEGIRTPDLLRAKQMLSQLSYVPKKARLWAFQESNLGPYPYQGYALTD